MAADPRELADSTVTCLSHSSEPLSQIGLHGQIYVSACILPFLTGIFIAFILHVAAVAANPLPSVALWVHKTKRYLTEKSTENN